MKAKIILCLLITLGSFLVVRNDNEADTDRKTKVLACINLTKAALHQDNDYFKEISDTLQFEEKEELLNKFLYKALLNCYGSVTLLKSADFIASSYEKINPFRKENKAILSLEKYNEKYLGNDARLQKDTEMFRKILPTIDEVKSLESMINTSINKLYSSSDFKNKQRKKEEAERAKRREEDPDAEIGGVNISFMKKIDPKILNGVGLGLIVVMFALLYWGLRALTKPKDVEKKIKNKKKN
jgi:hypothetical protein